MIYTVSEIGSDERRSNISTVKQRAQLRYRELRSAKLCWIAPLICAVLIIGTGITVPVLIKVFLQKPPQKHETIAVLFNTALRKHQDSSILQNEHDQVKKLLEGLIKTGSTIPLMVALRSYGFQPNSTVLHFMLPLEGDLLLKKVGTAFAEPFLLENGTNPSQQNSKEAFRVDAAAAGEIMQDVEGVHVLVESEEMGKVFNLTDDSVFTDPEKLSEEIEKEIQNDYTFHCLIPSNNHCQYYNDRQIYCNYSHIDGEVIICLHFNSTSRIYKSRKYYFFHRGSNYSGHHHRGNSFDDLDSGSYSQLNSSSSNHLVIDGEVIICVHSNHVYFYSTSRVYRNKQKKCFFHRERNYCDHKGHVLHHIHKYHREKSHFYHRLLDSSSSNHRDSGWLEVLKSRNNQLVDPNDYKKYHFVHKRSNHLNSDSLQILDFSSFNHLNSGSLEVLNSGSYNQLDFERFANLDSVNYNKLN
ncbi:hypothetical protein QR680_017911 [Steinernema hermaphroditum]|uniref:Uncharacterized protein n=1 Tax=Steinernema hermaphroditum TaxID=289476 RepID=A0AA39HHI2_9BILA|nr:hypothetical protein QR680_017911 [Steinernema hermaphroditum]